MRLKFLAVLSFLFISLFFFGNEAEAADSASCDGTYCYFTMDQFHGIQVAYSYVGSWEPYICNLTAGQLMYDMFVGSVRLNPTTASTMGVDSDRVNAGACSNSRYYGLDQYVTTDETSLFIAENLTYNPATQLTIRLNQAYVGAGIIADPSSAFTGSKVLVDFFNSVYTAAAPLKLSGLYNGGAIVESPSSMNGGNGVEFNDWPNICSSVSPYHNCLTYQNQGQSGYCSGGGAGCNNSPKNVTSLLDYANNNNYYYAKPIVVGDPILLFYYKPGILNRSGGAGGGSSWFSNLADQISTNITNGLSTVYDAATGSFIKAFTYLFFPSAGYLDTKMTEYYAVRDSKFPAWHDVTTLTSSLETSMTSGSSTAPTLPTLSMYGANDMQIMDTAPLDSYMPTLKNYERIFLWFFCAVYSVRAVHAFFKPESAINVQNI